MIYLALVKLKTLAMLFIAWLVSYVVTLFAFQAEQIKSSSWYESPAFAAAVAAGGVSLVLKYIDKRAEARREKKLLSDQKDARDQEDERQHLSHSEKLEEMTQRQLVEYLNRRDNVHNREVKVLRGQTCESDITRYELRERLNAAMNEISLMQTYLLRIQRSAIRSGVELEDYAVKSYSQIMEGIDVKVDTYAATRRAQLLDAEDGS